MERIAHGIDTHVVGGIPAGSPRREIYPLDDLQIGPEGGLKVTRGGGDPRAETGSADVADLSGELCGSGAANASGLAGLDVGGADGGAKVGGGSDGVCLPLRCGGGGGGELC